MRCEVLKKLLYNATFYTMKNPTDTVEAVLIEDGKIVATGSFEELKNRSSDHVNLDGAFMYPGFVDSHIHMIGHGDKLRHIDLSVYSSAETMTEELIKVVRNRDSEEWIVAEGWNENNFPDQKILHRTELDEITTNPLVL